MVYLLTFIFGLILGSFLNVIIVRFDDLNSAISGRSKCPKCGHKLHPADLIPLLSYLLLAGKCRYCKKPISWQYPLVELATAVLISASWYLVSNFTPVLNTQILLMLLLAVIFAIIIVLTVQDLKELLVADSLSYILLLAAFVFGFIYYKDTQQVILGAIVAVIPIILLVYPSSEKWMGKGDIKIALALGALVGYPNVWVLLGLAFVTGGLFGALLLVLKKAKPTTAVPFVPFLTICALITLFWGEYLLRWYLGLG